MSEQGVALGALMASDDAVWGSMRDGASVYASGDAGGLAVAVRGVRLRAAGPEDDDAVDDADLDEDLDEDDLDDDDDDDDDDDLDEFEDDELDDEEDDDEADEIDFTEDRYSRIPGEEDTDG